MNFLKKKEGTNSLPAINARHEKTHVNMYDQSRANKSIGTVSCKESKVS